MKLHYLKISVLVIGLAVMTYVFFPVSGKQDTAQRHSGPLAATPSQRDKSKTTRNQISKQTKHTRLVKKSGKKHVTEARIEPDTTLRKEGIHRRYSGPPSKMYGGL